jgi:hypothetical protein
MICLERGARVIEWYQLQDGVWFAQVPKPTDVEYNFGIVYTDLTPKPAYIAYGVMTEQLAGLRYLRREDLHDPELYAFAFGNDEQARVHVLWSYKEKHELDKTWAEVKTSPREPAMPWENRWKRPVQVRLPSAEPVTVTDIMGNTETVQPRRGMVRLSLTGSPVFVRGLLSTPWP